jgi:hypothetical protein
MRRQLALFILALSATGLACGSLDSAVEQAEEAIPTIEAAATAAAQSQEAQSDTSQDTQNEPSGEAASNDLCSILTFDAIKSVLDADEVSLISHTVGLDQASCSYTLDSKRVMSLRVDTTTSARSAKTVYEAVHVATFGTGIVVEPIEGPWTEGFWNGDIYGVFAVQDDQVTASIQYSGSDASNQDDLVELLTIFFERFP